MRNSKTKLAITTIFLAGTIGTFSASAHEGKGKGMMSSEGMQGMNGMMGMMSDMSPEDRKAMTDACIKMMQNQDSGHMDGGKKSKDAEAS